MVTSAEPGRDAPAMATCPACAGIVDLRSRRTGKNPDHKTWYYRHRRGPGEQCPRRSRTGWCSQNVANGVRLQATKEVPRPCERGSADGPPLSSAALVPVAAAFSFISCITDQNLRGSLATLRAGSRSGRNRKHLVGDRQAELTAGPTCAWAAQAVGARRGMRQPHLPTALLALPAGSNSHQRDTGG